MNLGMVFVYSINYKYIEQYVQFTCVYVFIWLGCIRELTAILDREAFTELHLSFRRSMTMIKPILAASKLQTGGRKDVNCTATLD